MTWRVICVLVCALAVGSCGGKEPAPEADSGEVDFSDPSALEVTDPSLPVDASPTQVAEALFAALDAKDEARLRGLAARTTIHQDVNRIGRGRITFSEAGAVETAINGWMMTYVFVRPGTTEVAREEIDGDRAGVFADCTNRNTEDAKVLKVELVRESPGWRVLRVNDRGIVRSAR
jgi:hypothetical protein